MPNPAKKAYDRLPQWKTSSQRPNLPTYRCRGNWLPCQNISTNLHRHQGSGASSNPDLPAHQGRCTYPLWIQGRTGKATLSSTYLYQWSGSEHRTHDPLLLNKH